MNGISIHVLDTSVGRPGSGVDVTLEVKKAAEWVVWGSDVTNEDGRIGSLLSDEEELVTGVYRVTFDTGSYYRHKGEESFYPKVVVVFEVANAEEHYHVPLLLNAFGYTTYRGS